MDEGFVHQTHPDSLQPGEVFARRYCVIRRIKAGAMGTVYEVRDTKTDTLRALKIMLPEVLDDEDLRSRFALEARVTGRIESDHIVKVLDTGVDDDTGHAFLLMELLRGEELGRLIRQRKRLSPSESLVYLRQLALALDKTHAAGIVHRDLKPDNLFVTTRDDGSACLKILDFGIAKVLVESQELNRTRPLGTPIYVSPEQALGQGVSAATDRYALGHIAYTMLVGESYWGSDEAAERGRESLVARVVVGATEPPSERALRRRNVQLPAGFDAWFFKATAVDPDKRFASGRETMLALAEVFDAPTRVAMPSEQDLATAASCATGGLGGTNMTATSATWAKPLQGRMLPLAGMLLGLIVLLGAIGFVIRNGVPEDKSAGVGSAGVASASSPVTPVSAQIEARTEEAPAAVTTASAEVQTERLAAPVEATTQVPKATPTVTTKATRSRHRPPTFTPH